MSKKATNKAVASPTAFDNLPRNAATILIDGRALLWTATEFALKKFPVVPSFTERKNTILWCMFERLSYPIRRFNTNRLVFAWESPKCKRTEIFPEYKARRKRAAADDPVMVECKEFWLEIQKKILPDLGFANNIEIEGFEGDDIMAQIALQTKKAPIIIFSEDGDMYQCIRQNVACMNTRVTRISKEGVPSAPKLLDRARFIKMQGIAPERWADAKAIGGCKSDNVPGVVGVSVETAVLYLNDLTDPKLYRKDGKPNARLLAIQNGKQTIAFTDRLVRLPFEGMPEIELKKDELSRAKFLKMCQTYQLNTLVSDFWMEFFG